MMVRKCLRGRRRGGEGVERKEDERREEAGRRVLFLLFVEASYGGVKEGKK